MDTEAAAAMGVMLRTAWAKDVRLWPSLSYRTYAKQLEKWEDFKGLKVLADIAGHRFHRGFVLYLGRQAVAFGPNLHAVPLTTLWEW